MIGSGHAMAQAVSRRPLTAEARFRSSFNPCGIFGGQNGIGMVCSPSSLVLPCRYYSTVALHAHTSPERRTTGPLVATVKRYRLIPSK
jgi:hypothetical protein